MFLLFGNWDIPSGGWYDFRGRYSDTLALVLDAEDYDYSHVVFEDEIIASYYESNGWWIGCYNDQCPASQGEVKELLDNVSGEMELI